MSKERQIQSIQTSVVIDSNNKNDTRDIKVDPEERKLVEDYAVEFGDDLFHAAVQLAEHENLGTVSQVHVRGARKQLRAQRNGGWRTKLAGTIGGACLGCALGIFGSIPEGQTASTGRVGLMLVLAIFGTGLAIFNAVRSR